MRRRDAAGFTLTEFLIATFIMLFTVISAYNAFMTFSKDAKILGAYLNSYLKGREVIDLISKDVRMAVRVMDTYGGFVSTDDCLVLKVPSLDEAGNVVNIDEEFDYVVYRLESGDLWKTVMPGSVSARAAYDDVFKKNIESLYITTAEVGLSSVAHKDAVMYVTLQVAITGTVLEKEYNVNAGTTVKLMNYEWRYVR